MSSSYRGVSLFSSGPHRFRVGRQGQLVVPEFSLGIPGSGSIALGLIELDVIVTGRLVANSGGDAALWALRTAMVDAIDDPPTTGTLVDQYGRQWSAMSFIRVEWGEVTDRGRVASIGYTATFRRFRVLGALPPADWPRCGCGGGGGGGGAGGT